MAPQLPAYRLKAVLFDFDGTLTQPGAIDFAAIRQAIDCPAGTPILEFIAALPAGDPARQQAEAVLHAREMEAAAQSLPRDGAAALVAHCKRCGLRVGLHTRNSRAAVARALENFAGLGRTDFDILITRDDPVAPKPHPDGVLLAAGRLGIDPEEILVVGDFRFDVEAGRGAGALTALLVPAPGGKDPGDLQPDFSITCLDDLRSIVRFGLPLPNGKFPSDLLGDYCSALPWTDTRILVRPGIGEDSAAIDVTGLEVLVVTSDPITFVTDAIGTYTVLVNANDVATAGAEPRWLLTTLLFPPGTTASQVRQVLADLQQASARWGITLCGGHTEITDAVTRPVVTGTLCGSVARHDLVDKGRMRPGDRILITKGVAVEGTAIIAKEFHRRLQTLGLPPEAIARCQGFRDQISILAEARVARSYAAVRAMHDVTEGGVATALHELSIAGVHRLRIHLDRIPVLPETRRICDLLGIDPLGLIGSGSLLICCGAEAADELQGELATQGIAVSDIGVVLDHGEGVEAWQGAVRAVWPEFEVDEITRLF
jgi:hydrogenase expression/formation protein HypE